MPICIRPRGLALAALLLLPLLTCAQSPRQLTSAEKKKVDGLVTSMSLQQRIDFIGGTGFALRAEPALKIPALEMSDGPYGVRSNANLPSTTYAAGISLASSWDRSLAQAVGSGIGRDARARGVHFMLGPGVNIYRSPRNGRNFEYFGEDPFLSSAMAAGYITGMQEQGVSATVKHYLGNNSEYLRHDSDTVMDERTAREIYLPAFEAAVTQAHVGAVMDSYNLINGVKSILVVGPDANPAVPVGGGSAGVIPFRSTSALLGLAGELGDGTAVLYDRGLPTVNQIVNGTSWSTAAANGERGIKLETFSNAELSGSPTVSIVPHLKLEGISFKNLMEDIEAAMALFTSPPPKASHRFTGYFNPPEAGKYILMMDGGGEGSGSRVHVDGTMVIDNWSLARAFQPHVTLDLSAGPHKIVVEQIQTGPFGGQIAIGITPASSIVNRQAIELASHADVVLVEAGYAQDSESEGGDRTFALPYGQDELIAAMVKANPKTIVAITSGGNVDSRSWLADVPAVLETWYAGQEGGRALAEILFGDINPSGHLPATFERNPEDNPTFTHYYPEPGETKVNYKEGIFVGYRGYEKNKTAPLFPFGFGLSYTTFKFSNLKVTAGSAKDAVVAFDLTNLGSREGAEVAQVYVTENQPKVERPEHELKGFERVDLKPGETRHVSIALNERAFSYYDVSTNAWTVGGPNFTISVGDSVATLPLKRELQLANGR